MTGLRAAWDRVLDFAIEAWLAVLDRVAPIPESPIDRAIREEGERLRKAFPFLDERQRNRRHPSLYERDIRAGKMKMSAPMPNRDRWWCVIGYEVSMLRFALSISSGLPPLNNLITEARVLHTRNLCDLCDPCSRKTDIKPSDLFDAYDTDPRYGRLKQLLQTFAEKYGKNQRGHARWAFNKMAVHPTQDRDTSFEYAPYLAHVLPVLFEIIAEMGALRGHPF
jgi:hypothetical protein